jgi:hypothetical protein
VGPKLTISVVIPTTGRVSLAGAVESALGQTLPPLEVVVVFDLPSTGGYEHPDERVRALSTGGGLGGNAARQLGVDAATGEAIALLDDDDRWAATKLETQADVYVAERQAGRHPIVGAALAVVDEAGTVIDQLPRRFPRVGESLENYLFRREQIRYGEAVFASSMVLAPRSLFMVVPLDLGLSIHQDWDWLIHASRVPRVTFPIVRSPQLFYERRDAGGSLSRAGQWQESAAWAQAMVLPQSRRNFGDFILGVTLPAALDSGSRATAWRLATIAFRLGRPGLPATVFAALTLLLPRRLLTLSARTAFRFAPGRSGKARRKASDA